MLLLKDPDRIRILAAVATRGPSYQVLRVVVITASLAILFAVPAIGLVRVDLWDGRHILMGEPVSGLVALRGMIIAIAVLWGVTFLTNMVVGRFFCGWGCPVGYVGRLGEDVDLKKKKRKHLRWLFSHAAGAGFVGTFIAAIMSWWVDPHVLLEGSNSARGTVAGIWLLFCGGGFLHAFVWRFGFCRSVCPIGLYYRFVTSKTPIGIAFREQPDPCIECGACIKICPVDLDPRWLGEPVAEGVHDAPPGRAVAAKTSHEAAHAKAPAATCATATAAMPMGSEASIADDRYGDAECIRCGDCVEACRMIFKGREGETPPLRFGRPASEDADVSRSAGAAS